MSFKNDDIDSVQYENKDESGFQNTENFSVFGTKTRNKDKSKLLGSLTCTAVGTHLGYHPIVVFTNELFCYYLKCYSANYNDGSPREKLFGDVLIPHAETTNGKEPYFLRNPSFVDTACLYKMRKDEFKMACEKNKIEYAEINCESIPHNKRLEILKQLITNLENREIALIKCDLNVESFSNETNSDEGKYIRTHFGVWYCPPKVKEKEWTFFERNNFPYNYKTEADKLKHKEILAFQFQRLDVLSNDFIEKNDEEDNSDIFKQDISFFKKVLNEELQHSPSNSGNSSSASGAPQNKQHDDEADALPRHDKNKQKSSWVDTKVSNNLDIEKIVKDFKKELDLDENDNLNKGFGR